MKNFIKGFGVFLMLAANIAFGYEAPTGWATVTKVTGAEVVRYEISGATLCGTNVFSIDLTQQGANQQVSILLLAAASGKKVWVETWLPCVSYTDYSKNWGMKGTVITAQFP